MHQATEIDKLHGFDPQKQHHIVWLLMEIIIREMEKSYTSSLIDRFFSLGRKSLAEELLNLITHKTTSGKKGYATQWYCPKCGFLNPEEISPTERCTICNNSL